MLRTPEKWPKPGRAFQREELAINAQKLEFIEAKLICGNEESKVLALVGQNLEELYFG